MLTFPDSSSMPSYCQVVAKNILTKHGASIIFLLLYGKEKHFEERILQVHSWETSLLSLAYESPNSVVTTVIAGVARDLQQTRNEVPQFPSRAASMSEITPSPILVQINGTPDRLRDRDKRSLMSWTGPIPRQWTAHIEQIGSTGFGDRPVPSS